MPTRILREGILTSEKVNSLSESAELFYRHLMSVVDDYGRYFSHPGLLRAGCYPLQLDTHTESRVKALLSECVAKKLILLYGGGKYVQIVNSKQQTRSPSKFPEPTANELLSIAVQMRSESESESETETKAEAPPSHFPEAVVPSWREFLDACTIAGGVAEWYAKDKFEAANQKRWSGILDIPAYARRVRGWWINDGSPNHPLRKNGTKSQTALGYQP